MHLNHHFEECFQIKVVDLKHLHVKYGLFEPI
jgi:hypothetical protein